MSSSSTSTTTSQGASATESGEVKERFSCTSPGGLYHISFHMATPTAAADYPEKARAECKVMLTGPESTMVQMLLNDVITDTDLKFAVVVRSLKATPEMPADSLLRLDGAWQASTQTAGFAEEIRVRLPPGIPAGAFRVSVTRGLMYGRVYPGKGSQLFLSFLFEHRPTV